MTTGTAKLDGCDELVGPPPPPPQATNMAAAAGNSVNLKIDFNIF